MNGHGIENKEVNSKWENENYLGVGKEWHLVMKWNCQVRCATSIVISNIILQKVSILEGES
jgi:hypothetical protein